VFESVNRLIVYCDKIGISDAIYNGVVIVAFVLQFLFLIFYRKKYQISLKQAIITVITVYPIGYFWMLVLSWVENGFKNWGSNNIVRVFVWLPLIAIPIAAILKLEKRTMTDYLAPSMALQQTIGHLVCPMVGCCCGYPCEWGIWNPEEETYLFPNQWLECIVAFAIFFALIIFASKTGYDKKGRLYPAFLISFGTTRFLLEFLRDNDKLFWGISNLALHALLMVIVGCVWLIRLRKWEKEKARKKVIYPPQKRKNKSAKER